MDAVLVANFQDASGPLPITWRWVGMVALIIVISFLLRFVLPSPEPMVEG